MTPCPDHCTLGGALDLLDKPGIGKCNFDLFWEAGADTAFQPSKLELLYRGSSPSGFSRMERTSSRVPCGAANSKYPMRFFAFVPSAVIFPLRLTTRCVPCACTS